MDHCKAGETPGWMYMEVVDLDTGEMLKGVKEVHCGEGWAIRHKLDDNGRLIIEGDAAAVERITGKFAVRLTSPQA